MISLTKGIAPIFVRLLLLFYLGPLIQFPPNFFSSRDDSLSSRSTLNPAIFRSATILIGLSPDVDLRLHPLLTKPVDSSLVKATQVLLSKRLRDIASALPEIRRIYYARFMPSYAVIRKDQEEPVLLIEEHLRQDDLYKEYGDTWLFLHAILLAHGGIQYRLHEENSQAVRSGFSDLTEQVALFVGLDLVFWNRMTDDERDWMRSLAAQLDVREWEKRLKKGITAHFNPFQVTFDRFERYSREADEEATWRNLSQELKRYPSFRDEIFDYEQFQRLRQAIRQMLHAQPQPIQPQPISTLTLSLFRQQLLEAIALGDIARTKELIETLRNPRGVFPIRALRGIGEGVSQQDLSIGDFLVFLKKSNPKKLEMGWVDWVNYPVLPGDEIVAWGLAKEYGELGEQVFSAEDFSIFRIAKASEIVEMRKSLNKAPDRIEAIEFLESREWRKESGGPSYIQVIHKNEDMSSWTDDRHNFIRFSPGFLKSPVKILEEFIREHDKNNMLDPEEIELIKSKIAEFRRRLVQGPATVIPQTPGIRAAIEAMPTPPTGVNIAYNGHTGFWDIKIDSGGTQFVKFMWDTHFRHNHLRYYPLKLDDRGDMWASVLLTKDPFVTLQWNETTEVLTLVLTDEAIEALRRDGFSDWEGFPYGDRIGWAILSETEWRRMQTSVSDRLGARLGPSREVEPILVGAIPQEVLAGAEARLAQRFPRLAERYRQVNRKYFAKFMKGAAGLKQEKDGVTLLLEDRYKRLPDARGVSKEARDLLIFLHLVHELVELELVGTGETLTPEFNREMAAFIAQAMAYYDFSEEEKRLLREAAAILDKGEPDLADRFGPVLKFMDQFDKESILADQNRQQIVEFIAGYPGFERKDYHIQKIGHVLDHLSIFLPTGQATLIGSTDSTAHALQLQPRTKQEMLENLNFILSKLPNQSGIQLIENQNNNSIAIRYPLKFDGSEYHEVLISYASDNRTIESASIVKHRKIPKTNSPRYETAIVILYYQGEWERLIQKTSLPQSPIRDFGISLDKKRLVLVVADEALETLTQFLWRERFGEGKFGAFLIDGILYGNEEGISWKIISESKVSAQYQQLTDMLRFKLLAPPKNKEDVKAQAIEYLRNLKLTSVNGRKIRINPTSNVNSYGMIGEDIDITINSNEHDNPVSLLEHALELLQTFSKGLGLRFHDQLTAQDLRLLQGKITEFRLQMAQILESKETSQVQPVSLLQRSMEELVEDLSLPEFRGPIRVYEEDRLIYVSLPSQNGTSERRICIAYDETGKNLHRIHIDKEVEPLGMPKYWLPVFHLLGSEWIDDYDNYKGSVLDIGISSDLKQLILVIPEEGKENFNKNLGGKFQGEELGIHWAIITRSEALKRFKELKNMFRFEFPQTGASELKQKSPESSAISKELHRQLIAGLSTGNSQEAFQTLELLKDVKGSLRFPIERLREVGDEIENPWMLKEGDFVLTVERKDGSLVHFGWADNIDDVTGEIILGDAGEKLEKIELRNTNHITFRLATKRQQNRALQQQRKRSEQALAEVL